MIELDTSKMFCRECGCTDDQACAVGLPGHEVGCHWVAPFLCSACRDEGIRLYQIAVGRAAA